MKNVLLIVEIVTELVKLVRRAQAAGRDVTEAELQAALARADSAESAWEESKTQEEEEETDGST